MRARFLRFLEQYSLLPIARTYYQGLGALITFNEATNLIARALNTNIRTSTLTILNVAMSYAVLLSRPIEYQCTLHNASILNISSL